MAARIAVTDQQILDTVRATLAARVYAAADQLIDDLATDVVVAALLTPVTTDDRPRAGTLAVSDDAVR